MTDRNTARTFFSRLRSDVRGNTLAMVAGGLVPLAGMIGSGVDLSRAYMVKTRLQQACDAGVLAGRKAMGDGSYDTQARAQTESFFNANFPTGYLDSTNRTFTPVSPSGTSSVNATASVELPTIVMKLFGNDEIDVEVDCTAILEIANSDITMVLDTTGSMAYSIDDGSGGTITRLLALQNATKSFYDIVYTASQGSGSRIRYGLVPYTGTVNIGEQLYDLDPTYLIGGTSGDVYNYQSRQAWYEYQESEEVIVPAGTTSTFYESQYYISDGDCTRFGNNQDDVDVYYRSGSSYYYWYEWEPSDWGYSYGEPATLSGDSGATYTFSRDAFYGPYICRRAVTRTTTTDTTETQTVTKYTLDPTVPGATFSYWEHTQIGHEVYDFVRSVDKDSGGSYVNSAVAIPTLTSSSTTRWEGCIQERDTVDSDVVAYDGVTDAITPSGAFDLDIDSVPTSDATRWRPYWPEVTYYRDNIGAGSETYTYTTRKSQTACPQEVNLLSELTETQFDNYVDALAADGGTYHDVGMLWGARISSPEGVFSANVTATPTNSGFVNRHLIFMTDGVLDIGDTYHSAYGIERHDMFVGTGNETQASTNHTTRFNAICEATRAKGIRVWVIAFATSLTQEMIDCASANSSFTSTNAAQLEDAFETIANSVADLRLSK
ncbi:TadE/TadG family type IV pilus assembly protein [Parasphingorhabdus sp.]|uniref:TadE/TadG family type IV pilus assembly protein n=1 Tax=Parasphingorhabdus sp. TaxID=2709688 RepID=UPI003266BE61